MPSKKSAPRWHAAPAVEARPSTVEEAETLAVAPVAEAIEVPAVDATPNQGAGGHKRSRVYEVFEADPTDTNYVFCQCREGVFGGNSCGERVKSQHGPTILWNHLKSKHPATRAILKDCAGAGDTHASTAARLAQPAQLAVNVSYQHQMVDSLSSAPLEVLADAIAALQQAREERSQHV